APGRQAAHALQPGESPDRDRPAHRRDPDRRRPASPASRRRLAPQPALLSPLRGAARPRPEHFDPGGPGDGSHIRDDPPQGARRPRRRAGRHAAPRGPRQETPAEIAQARRLARMMEDPRGKELTIALVDQAFRSRRPERIADQLSYLLHRYGTPHFMEWWERVALMLGGVMGHYLPSVIVRRRSGRVRSTGKFDVSVIRQDAPSRHVRRSEGGLAGEPKSAERSFDHLIGAQQERRRDR